MNTVGLQPQLFGNIQRPVKMVFLCHDNDLFCAKYIPGPVQAFISTSGSSIPYRAITITSFYCSTIYTVVSLVRVVEVDETEIISMFDNELFDETNKVIENVATDETTVVEQTKKKPKARKRAKKSSELPKSDLDIKVGILEGEWFD